MNKIDDTKEKILQVACQLFASKGFHGVSIRDIAKKAKVNLSAVNYHFKSKNGLFGAILANSKKLFNQEVEALDDGKIGALEFALKIQEIFVEHSNEFRNGFAVFLSGEDNTDLIEQVYSNMEELGPPGHIAFKRVLQRSIEGVGDLAANWATQVILGYLAHDTMFTQTHLYKVACNAFPQRFGAKVQIVSITEMVKSVLRHLEINHKQIEEDFLDGH